MLGERRQQSLCLIFTFYTSKRVCLHKILDASVCDIISCLLMFVVLWKNL